MTLSFLLFVSDVVEALQGASTVLYLHDLKWAAGRGVLMKNIVLCARPTMLTWTS